VTPLLFCEACEAPTVNAGSLGFIQDDGTVGRVDGFACRRCHHIWEAPEANSIITGHVDLGGRIAMDWLLTGLQRLGCDPRPRP
jgi:hypothetical protein